MTAAASTPTAPAAESPPAVGLPAGRHDAAKRRQAKRTGREKGCWLYIPAEQLLTAGIDPNGPAPYYRTWASRRGGFTGRLYREP